MIHTCLIGPLCDEWPQEENPDDPRTGCDHWSCLAIVNDWGNCQACWSRLSDELDQIDPPGPSPVLYDEIAWDRFQAANTRPRTITLDL